MITALNLASIPFISNTDSTRLQMAAKQIQQALTSVNTDIPYVLSNNWEYLTKYSTMGIKIAKDDGKVIFNDNEIMIIWYKNLNIIDIFHIPLYLETNSIFASQLRFSLEENKDFRKGDILYEYDCFKNGKPSIGYNFYTAYMNFFGYNHEDSLIISESAANKAIVNMVDTVYIPIYEFTVLQPIYQDIENSFVYFPSIGQNIIDDIVCAYFTPKDGMNMMTYSDPSINDKMRRLILSMNVSDLINLSSNRKFVIDKVKTKLQNGKIFGLRIHKLKKNGTLFDKRLDSILSKMHSLYGQHIINITEKLTSIFQQDFVKDVLKKYYIYADRERKKRILDLKDVIYLIEFKIVKENISMVGDKFANRYAGKGVTPPLIIPDDERPISLHTNIPIDVIMSPFSVFSRMNIGQLLEGIIAKNVMIVDMWIKYDKNKAKDMLHWLNDNIIKYLDENYHNQCKELINNNLEEIIEDVIKTNLYVEANQFGKIDLRQIVANSVPILEDVKINKKMLKRIYNKFELDLPDFEFDDVIIPNIFCAPIHYIKIGKLADKEGWARDFGPVSIITGQPTKGKSKGGGLRVGQMEVEGILAHGAINCLKEIFSVKSDAGKLAKDLVRQMLSDGEYQLPDDCIKQGKTAEVINVILDFLRR